MAEVLIYTDTSQSSTQDEITSLLWARQTPFTCIKSAEEIEENLKRKKVDLLIIILKEFVPYSLERVITKNRNLSNLRRTPIVAVHQRYSDTEIQKTLMLGIKEIFVEPFDKTKIIQFLLQPHEISLSPELAQKKRLYFEIGPIPCRVDIFGRIGKIFKIPLGNIQVETNLILDQNEKLKIATQIASDIKLDFFDYSVLQSEGMDRYYNYHFSYILKLHLHSSFSEKLFKWIKLHPKEFSLPKTKLLWITNHLTWKLESVLPKDIFSIYTQPETGFSVTGLEKLNPKIVILENPNEKIEAELLEWKKEKKEAEKLIFNQFDKNHKNFEYIPSQSAELFRQKFLTKIKDNLKQNVSSSIDQAQFLSRKSNYSRFAVVMKGEITAASEYRIRVDLPHRISGGTIFRLHCPFLDDPSRSVLYAKVLNYHRYADSELYTHECDIVPDSLNPNQTLRELKILFDPKEKQKMDTTKIDESGKDLFFFFNAESKNERYKSSAYFLLTLGVALTITIFLLYLLT